MTRPQFTPSISWGNIINAIGLVVLLGGSVAAYQDGFSRADENLRDLEVRQQEDRASMRENTKAIRSLEMSGAVINQRLIGIEQTARRIEQAVEKLTEQQE